MQHVDADPVDRSVNTFRSLASKYRGASETRTSEAIPTWLGVGDPARDEEFGQRCSAGVNALWPAWNTPLS